jgi:hypothetical protein
VNKGYLRRNVLILDRTVEDVTELNDLGDEEDIEDSAEALVARIGPQISMVQYICWSVTYQVPIFCFTAHDAGKSLNQISFFTFTLDLQSSWVTRSP